MGERKKGAKMLAEYVKITKTQIGTNKKRRKKLQMDKEKDNEDRKRKLELRKNEMQKCNQKIRLCRPKS
jgi:hypothetical protein